ncbi:hypothetical protein LJC72_06220 [Bacteroides sp. OttesenSCG-928-D19]|nr:hypothetical protein [Bacteroides sp. OttesenSCG-928-D19]
MKKIIYIHGLSSSGNSNTTRLLKLLLPNVQVLSPDLPINPQEAVCVLKELCKREAPDLVMGTSMGGMFAQQLHGYKKILVNPAFHVSETVRKRIGINPFLNKRKDGSTSYEITEELCNAYFEMEQQQFAGITPFDKENTYAFFGNEDDEVCCYEEYHQYYQHCIWYLGKYRLTFEAIQEDVLPAIEYLLDQID